MPTWFASIARKLMPLAWAAWWILSASVTLSVRVSNHVLLTTCAPALVKLFATAVVMPYTRSAIFFKPAGPWYTAYMLAIIANNACAVQIFEVAFSRRMCCSRVCKAKRNALLPCASTDTPTKRPGILRLYASRVAMYAACGPPKPNGTPKRWVLPITMSAPHSAGDFKTVSASKSAAAITVLPCACTLAAQSL